MCGNPLTHKNVNVLQFLNATNEQIKKKRRKKKRKKEEEAKNDMYTEVTKLQS